MWLCKSKKNRRFICSQNSKNILYISGVDDFGINMIQAIAHIYGQDFGVFFNRIHVIRYFTRVFYTRYFAGEIFKKK